MATRKTLKIFCALALLGLLIAGAASSCGRFSGKPKGTRQAEALVSRAVKSLGGRGALEATRFLAFDFIIEQAGRPMLRRSHTWDRETGRYRLEWVAPDGQPFVALFNVNTRQGQVFSGNKMQASANPAQALAEAYRDHLADTAFLLGVFRLTEPGVQLDYAGQEEIAGRSFPYITATATGPAVGRLPGVQNWIYFDPDTGRPFAWTFVPQGAAERAAYIYANFQPVGKVTLPGRLDRSGSAWSIVFSRLLSLETITDNVFESVSGPLEQKITPLKPGQAPPPLTAR